MPVKYQIRTVVDKDIKDRISELMALTGHSESKQTKVLLKQALDMNEQLKALNK